MKYPLGTLIGAALAVVLAATATQAATSAMGGIHSRKHVTTHSTFTPSGFHHGRKVGWRRHNSTVPPGWHHGKKVGWGSTRTMPPGLHR